MATALLCPIRRKQVVLADTQQGFIRVRGSDHLTGIASADRAALKPPLRQIIEAQIPEGNTETVGDCLQPPLRICKSGSAMPI